eukprot:5665306-Lingulodinium_polyedra.AAC.1
MFKKGGHLSDYDIEWLFPVGRLQVEFGIAAECTNATEVLAKPDGEEVNILKGRNLSFSFLMNS